MRFLFFFSVADLLLRSSYNFVLQPLVWMFQFLFRVVPVGLGP